MLTVNQMKVRSKLYRIAAAGIAKAELTEGEKQQARIVGKRLLEEGKRFEKLAREEAAKLKKAKEAA